LSFLNLSILR